jgi:carboxypeptidase C (cathepsin A)
MENGPYKFKYNPLGRPALNFTYNNFSWTNNASVIYLDFPIGNGFSFAPDLFSYRILDT